jgi:hypothetical protein
MPDAVGVPDTITLVPTIRLLARAVAVCWISVALVMATE